MANKQIVTFRLDPEQIDNLRLVHDRDGVLPSEQVRRALKAWFEQKGISKRARIRRTAANRKP